MSDRSLSPNRSYGKDASREFREHRDVEDYDENVTDDEQNDSDVDPSFRSTYASQCKPESPQKADNQGISPHGSPRPKQRKFGDPRSPENKVSVEREDKIVTYETKKSTTLNQAVLEKSAEHIESSPRASPTTVKGKAVSQDVLKTLLDGTSTNEGTKDSFLSNILCFGGLFIAILVGVIIHMGLFDKSNSKKLTNDKNEVSFSINWLNLKSGFASQSTKFWEITGAATRSVVVQANPSDPAVILIVVPESATATSRCFVSKYVEAVTDMFKQRGAALLNCKTYTDLSPGDAKLKIDNKLESAFNRGQKVAVIEHLESLEPEAAMIFYKFCDNDQAPFKKASILFTLHVSDEEFMLSNEMDHYVEEKLAKLWEPTLGPEKFQPLMSRIANSVVFIKPESQESIKNC